MHEGLAAREMGVPGLPREEEDGLVARDIRLSSESGHPVHIQHLSTAGSVAAVREARSRGVPVTAEAAPHHLLLIDRDVTGPDQKMNPPLREEEDRQALIEGLRDRTIDAVATDHAPHAPELKDRGLLEAPFGVIGMESAFPVLYTGLVRPGLVTLDRLIELFTSGPAGVGGVPGGRLVEGDRAELNLLDLTAPFRFDAGRLRSRSRNCPFLGRDLLGRVAFTVAGKTLSFGEIERFRS